MSTATDTLETLLHRLLTNLPPLAEAGGAILTSRVLAELARSWPASPSPGQQDDLDALCRKVHVVKRVMATYGRRWRKARGATPLPASRWPLLIVVLLAYARVGQDGTESARGRALKNLNAALTALDLAAGQGKIEHLGELESEARKLLVTWQKTSDEDASPHCPGP